MTIAQALRAERAIARKTQQEVAKVLGVSVGTIANWESDTNAAEPRFNDLVALAGVFGKPLSEWLPVKENA